MDVTLPHGENVKLHVNPARGGELNFPKLAGPPAAAPGAPAGPGSASVISPPPELSSMLAHPPVTAVPPPDANHLPVAIPPTVLDHPPLPPWLQNPSSPGFDVHPSEPPLFAPLDNPGDTAPAPPSMTPGPPITLHIPELHAPEVHPPPEHSEACLGSWVPWLSVDWPPWAKSARPLNDGPWAAGAVAMSGGGAHERRFGGPPRRDLDTMGRVRRV